MVLTVFLGFIGFFGVLKALVFGFESYFFGLLVFGLVGFSIGFVFAFSASSGSILFCWKYAEG